MLTTIALCTTAAIPGLGEVRRSSLFGFSVGGEVLELDEAAARAEAAAKAPRPGLVRLPPPAQPADPPVAEEPASRPGLSRTDPALPPCGSVDCDPEEGNPCALCAAAFAAEVDDEIALLYGGDELEQLPPATAESCRRCGGTCAWGARSCAVCLGRGVRVVVGGHEIVQAPPDTEPARLAAAYALADVLGELNERQVLGARALLGVILADAEQTTRANALEQWRWKLDRLAEALAVAS